MKARGFLLVSLAFAAVCGCGRGAGRVKAGLDEARIILKGEVKTEPVEVKVLPAVSGENVSTAAYVGTVQAGRSTIVSTNNSGTLGSFRLKSGDKVNAGDIVAKVESQTIRSAYEAARSTLAQAKDGYARLQKVYASGSVAEVKMVEMETNLAKAQATFDAAQKALWHCTVKAPISGTVGEVYATDGSEVGPAAPLIQIVDTRSNEIHFPVPEAELSVVSVGERAQVEIPALGRTIQARVASKGVVASQLSHCYDCTLGGVEKEKDLMPGMVCKVRLYSDSKVATVIPASAVMTDTRGRYVWTVDSEGVVGKDYITVGGYSGNGIVVDGGLPDSVRVIIEGSRKVSTGMKVIARE